MVWPIRFGRMLGQLRAHNSLSRYSLKNATRGFVVAVKTSLTAFSAGFLSGPGAASILSRPWALEYMLSNRTERTKKQVRRVVDILT